MSQRTNTDAPAVEPSAEAVTAITPTPAEGAARSGRKRRAKAATAETTTNAAPTPESRDESKPPLSADDIAAACRTLLVDYLTGSAGLPPAEAEAAAERAARALAPPPAPAARDDTKLAALIALLRRRQGATIAEMVAATGWQAHSVRSALSGTLKKKHGLAVTSAAGEGGRVYRLPAEG